MAPWRRITRPITTTKNQKKATPTPVHHPARRRENEAKFPRRGADEPPRMSSPIPDPGSEASKKTPLRKAPEKKQGGNPIDWLKKKPTPIRRRACQVLRRSVVRTAREHGAPTARTRRQPGPSQAPLPTHGQPGKSPTASQLPLPPSAKLPPSRPLRIYTRTRAHPHTMAACFLLLKRDR